MYDDYYKDHPYDARVSNTIVILYSGITYTIWSYGGAVDGLGTLVGKILYE